MFNVVSYKVLKSFLFAFLDDGLELSGTDILKEQNNMMSGNESIGVSYCTILSREEEKSIVML